MTKTNIECLIVDDELIAREILENHISKISTFHIVDSCKNAIEAFHIINSQKVDLIFLDINMPDISGLSFAKSINKNIKIIFTTAYREYAVDGFDLQAVDYLLKPISFERFLKAVNKYLDENLPANSFTEENTVDDSTDFVFVRSDRKMVKINFSEITYIESLCDYIKIHLADKTVVTREPISSIEAKLPQKDFLRVHRSYIISLKCINSFTNEYIEINAHEIPISRSYKDMVLKKLINKD